jgi:hypothetical protein
MRQPTARIIPGIAQRKPSHSSALRPKPSKYGQAKTDGVHRLMHGELSGRAYALIHRFDGRSPLAILLRQRVNFRHPNGARDEAWYSKYCVHMHLVIVEQRDPLQMRPGDEIQDVAAGAAKPDDGDLFASQEVGDIV